MKEQAKERLKIVKSNQSKSETKNLKIEKKLKQQQENITKKGQFKDVEETFDYQLGERGGTFEIRYSKRTGKHIGITFSSH